MTAADAPQPTRRPHPIDRSVWDHLNGPAFRLLDCLTYLSRLTAKRSAHGAHYCTPGRAWLADQLGCSVRTISRHTTQLAALGVITKTQRRPRRGHWSTNLYRVISRTGWRAARFAQQLRALTHRLTRPAHIASPSRRENVEQTTPDTLAAVLARGRARFCPG